MNARDVMTFAAGALTGHRLRSVLTVAGVTVGTAAVVALTALGEGARRYVTQEFMALGSNLLIVVPGRVETTGAQPLGGVEHDLTLDDFQAVATRLPRVARAAPFVIANDTVRYGDRGRTVPIAGTTADFALVRHITVAAGRFLPVRDPQEAGNEMVVGPLLARELFGAESPLGRVVRMGTWRFRVVGVLAPRGRSLGQDLDDLAFIPVKTCMQAFNRPSLFRVLLEARSRGEMEAARQDVLDLLEARHRARDVTVITQDAVATAFSAILRALTLVLGAIASVSLAVAGVGIMNVMLVSVTERRPEVGLLKAMGATNRQVLSVFLVESALLSSVGGLSGLALGELAVKAFTRVYPSFPAAPPLWAVAAAMALSLGVGIAFGLWPAYRASRLDPLGALTRR